MKPWRWLVLGPIGIYRRVISPVLPRHCKYEPTCSHYASQAVRELGLVRGVVLGAWRLVRCNPFSHGGFDPVSAQRIFGRMPRDPARATGRSQG